jgi:hypothetical protein
LALLNLLANSAADAVTLTAGPSDYRTALRQLSPGDTLILTPGIYRGGLDIHRLQGTAIAPIVVQGATGRRKSTFVASPGRNTVSIVDSAFVTLADLHLDGRGVPVDAVKAEGTAAFAHDITLQRLHIEGYGASQQNVAVSTKCPTWNWAVRDNIIVGAGTGMYLGNSDGTAPFVRGTIEGNIVLDTIGYNLQIKHQNGRPGLSGMVEEPVATVIRNNVFAKTRNASAGENARPNVLIGHLPKSGLGTRDQYELDGNVFFQNPSEALFQGEGNLRVLRNLFYTSTGDALVIRPHNDVPKAVSIDGNFVAAVGRGIVVSGGDPTFNQEVKRNSVFAADPVRGGFRRENWTGSWSDWQGAFSEWQAAAGLRLSPAVAKWARSHCAASVPPGRGSALAASAGNETLRLCDFLSLLSNPASGKRWSKGN